MCTGLKGEPGIDGRDGSPGPQGMNSILLIEYCLFKVHASST